MTSKAVDDRVKIASTVFSVLEMHEAELVGPLTQRLFPDGGALFDVGVVLATHRAVLARARDAVLEADREVDEEAGDDQQYRDLRDEAVEAVRKVIQEARGLMDAAYTPDVLAHYCLDEELPRSPDRLAELADRIIASMRTRELVERSPYGFDLDLGPIADRIETALIPLGTALEDIRREVREIKEAIAARNEALESFDEVYEAVSEVIHAYCLLAGRPDLAELLK